MSCLVVPSYAAPVVCCGGSSSYSTANCRNNRYDYNRKSCHCKILGTLVGVLGTVAAIGLSTVLSETQEDCRYDDESKQRTDTSVKKEVAFMGEGGTEKEHRAEEVIIRHIQQKGLYSKKQTENLSNYEMCVKKARKILRHCMHEAGAPGMVVAVTVNGKQVWADGRYVHHFLP